MLREELLRRLLVSRDPLTATDELGFPRQTGEPSELDRLADERSIEPDPALFLPRHSGI